MNEAATAISGPFEGPMHIAIIMDGNGRWAAKRHLPRVAGHRAGVKAVRACVQEASRLGLPYLTLFAFSSENWRRPETEVSELMGLLRRYIRDDLDELAANGVKLKVIGNRARLASDLQTLIAEAETRTSGNNGLRLTIALSYGSRDEMADAVKSISEKVAAGELSPTEITAETVDQYLETRDLPDPDLIIRTSGEKRLSNCFNWQACYSELLFLDDFWPDFTEQHLRDAIEEYSRRERRYGAV